MIYIIQEFPTPSFSLAATDLRGAWNRCTLRKHTYTMEDLPGDLHRLVVDNVPNPIDRARYATAFKGAAEVCDQTHARAVFEHLEAALGGGGGRCAMRFLEATGACVAGSAVMKSFARRAAPDDEAFRQLAEQESMRTETDVDFWVPQPAAMEGHSCQEVTRWARETVLSRFASFLGPAPVVTEMMMMANETYDRLHEYVMVIMTVTGQPGRPSLQFMILQNGVSARDVISNFDIRGLQHALSLPYGATEPLPDHISFLRRCALSQEALDDLLAMRISSGLKVAKNPHEWIRMLGRVAKYVRIYGWTVSAEELGRMRDAFMEAMVTEDYSAYMHQVYAHYWNCMCRRHGIPDTAMFVGA